MKIVYVRVYLVYNEILAQSCKDSSRSLFLAWVIANILVVFAIALLLQIAVIIAIKLISSQATAVN